ncbi:hypothetical protein EV424DRAFT_1371425 [Suillus variegatus]|nr:hypothetical protein EV424DRAFT_1371425 [Suillus variegatus]
MEASERSDGANSFCKELRRSFVLSLDFLLILFRARCHLSLVPVPLSLRSHHLVVLLFLSFGSLGLLRLGCVGRQQEWRAYRCG